MGLKRALALLAYSFVVSLAFGSIGVATGLVYGPYHYTDKLGPNLTQFFLLISQSKTKLEFVINPKLGYSYAFLRIAIIYFSESFA